MRLKSIPLREPSGRLETAVLAQKPESREIFPLGFVPLRWAIALSLFMGIVGFYVGTHWHPDSKAAEMSPVNTTYVYLISDSASSKRWFDLTSSNNLPSVNQWKIITKDAKGEHHEQSL